MIRALRAAGKPMRKIAHELGVSYWSVRIQLIRAGDHTIAHRRVVDGRAACRVCKGSFLVEELALGGDHGYVCSGCETKRGRKYQQKPRGCSESQYEALLLKQGGKCAICGATHGHVSKRGVVCRLAVDHDHRTGTIRGLLCNSCNRGLGRFKDSVVILEVAARYLREAQ